MKVESENIETVSLGRELVLSSLAYVGNEALGHFEVKSSTFNFKL
tara:strand:- start:12125 stop:12259 length:135 start_codon:yes stop_codon:yes gene_type:complete